MLAVYAKAANPSNPLESLVVGDRPEPETGPGWLRVRISHASLNRHDIFTLRGITAHEEGIAFPMILGNDGAGVLDDGTAVAVYPVMGAPDWRDDETLDPGWHIFSEFQQGTMADYVAVPSRNAIPIPDGLSPLHAALLGTAWLTAYRSLFTKSGLRPGQTLLVQGASGGMSTALIQLGRAAGFEVWVMTRNEAGAALAEKLGVRGIFRPGERLPRRVDAVVDNVGAATWGHSLECLKRGGTLVINGVTTGSGVTADLLRILVEQIDIRGTIMGTRTDMVDMMNFVIGAGIQPETGLVTPMENAREAFQDMVAGRTHGKAVFTR